ELFAAQEQAHGRAERRRKAFRRRAVGHQVGVLLQGQGVGQQRQGRGRREGQGRAEQGRPAPLADAPEGQRPPGGVKRRGLGDSQRRKKSGGWTTPPRAPPPASQPRDGRRKWRKPASPASSSGAICPMRSAISVEKNVNATPQASQRRRGDPPYSRQSTSEAT